MAESSKEVRIPLSAYHRARLVLLGNEKAGIEARIEELVNGVIGNDRPPSEFNGWKIERHETEIVCTKPDIAPPAEVKSA